MGSGSSILDYGKICGIIKFVYKSLGMKVFSGDCIEISLVEGNIQVSLFSIVGKNKEEVIGSLKYDVNSLSGELAYLVDILVVSNLASCIIRVDESEKNLVSEKCRKLNGLGCSKLEIGEKLLDGSGLVVKGLDNTNFYLKLLRDFFCGSTRSDMGVKILERFYSSGSNCCLSIDTVEGGYKVFLSVENELEGTIHFNNDLVITGISDELLLVRKSEDWENSLARVFISLDEGLNYVLSKLDYVKYTDWNVERVDLVNIVTVDSISERGCLDCHCYLGITNTKDNI